MDCARIRFYLSPYADGELPPSDTREVASHLANCPRCAERFDSMTRVRELVRHGSPRPAVPEDLCRRIAERRPLQRGWRRNLRPAVMAAVLCLAVIPVVADSSVKVPTSRASLLLEPPVERVVRGRFICLRCLLAHQLGLAPAAGKTSGYPHVPAFQSDDGSIWLLLNREACPRPLPTREVSVTGRFLDDGHVVAAERVQLAAR